MIVSIRNLFMLTGLIFAAAVHSAEPPDPASDILVTFANEGANAASVSFGAPYRNRKRYRITAEVRRDSRAVEKEYALTAVDHWPIDSLGVYCFVYRPKSDEDRDALIAKLNEDDRVDSAQPLNTFRTLGSNKPTYNDTYLNLQHGLDRLAALDAHRYTRGQGIRIAIIDSHIDTDHEDLAGRVASVDDHAGDDRQADRDHGTAIASVIGASANNARGIVGVAPEAQLELHVSCWTADDGNTVCDSFSLAKALDTVLKNPPQLLNLSLQGPDDRLIGRLLDQAYRDGVITIAADEAGLLARSFPASKNNVIGVAHRARADVSADVYAPGEQIMVALPHDKYDFRSGSSLAAAHVTGVAALVLSLSPRLDFETLKSLLHESQSMSVAQGTSVDACRALALLNLATECRAMPATAAASER